MGIKRKQKNVYKRTPSKRKPFRYIGVFLKVLFAFCLLTFMSTAVIFVYDITVQSKIFLARTISVNGNSRISDKQVIRYSKLNIGENIFSMNLSAAKKRLLYHPMIAAVTMKRNIPSGITIHVEEHTPVAILDIGRTFAINADGEIFMETSVSEMPSVPVIIGFTPSDIDRSGKLNGTPFKEVMTLLHIGRRPNSSLPAHRIKRIYMDKQTGLTVDISGRIKRIILGFGNYSKKIDRLKTIFTFLNKRQDLKKFIAIDMMNLNRIVLKSSH